MTTKTDTSTSTKRPGVTFCTPKPKPAKPAPEPYTAVDFQIAGTWPTVQEVADAYGIRKRWLLDMIADRKFRVIRLNSLRIDPEDFTRFLNDLNEKYEV